MKLMKSLIALALIGMAAGANVPMGAIKIIANLELGTSEISRDELSRIFLMTKTSLPKVSHVEPVLEKSGAVHDMFVREYMGKTEAALMTYYRSLVFTGKASIPKTFNSDPEVAEYVARTKGAIGYVSASASTPGVKTLTIK